MVKRQYFHVLYVTYVFVLIILGAGMAFYNVPIFVLLTKYFDKRQRLANAVFISGNALGGIVFPPIFRIILDEYGIRGGLIMTAGIVLHSAISAMLLRPTSFYTKCFIKFPDTSGGGSTNDNTNAEDDTVSNSVNAEQSTCNNLGLNIQNDSSPTKLFNASLHLSSTDSYSPCPFLKENEYDDSNEKHLCSSHSKQRDERHIPQLVASVGNLSNISMEVATTVDTSNEEINSQKLSPLRVKNFDKGLLRKKMFLLFMAIYSFANVGVATAPVYLATLGDAHGFTAKEVAFCLSLNNISDFLGRILAGCLADSSVLSSQQIVLVSQIVIGIITQFTMFYTTIAGKTCFHHIVFYSYQSINHN